MATTTRRQSTHEVILVGTEQGLLFEAAGIADIFCEANRALPENSPLPRYVCRVVSTTRKRSIEGRSGLRLAADLTLWELDPTRRYDTVIVTGRSRSSPTVAAVAEWMRLAARKASRVASVCAGAFVLAEAGLLNGRRATTHWQSIGELARDYPEIRVEPDPIFVQDGNVFTSAGAAAGMDLALAFVEADLGPDLARSVARFLVIYLRRPGGQSQFSAALEREARSPGPVRDIQSWILEHLEEDLRVERLAEQVAMSPRNFARVFCREVGVTPARYVEELRVEEAKRRLEQGDEIVERIGVECGLGSALGMRRAFQRHLGISPGEYRERFGRN